MDKKDFDQYPPWTTRPFMLQSWAEKDKPGTNRAETEPGQGPDNTAKAGHEYKQLVFRPGTSRPIWLQPFKTYANEEVLKRNIMYLDNFYLRDRDRETLPLRGTKS